MAPHAKKRVFHISPQFDGIYWESFELADSSGNIHSFRYDHWLLENDCVWNVGDSCKTTYWQKARWGNLRMEAEIRIDVLPEKEKLYHGHSNIDYRCQGVIERRANYIPASTLK